MVEEPLSRQSSAGNVDFFTHSTLYKRNHQHGSSFRHLAKYSSKRQLTSSPRFNDHRSVMFVCQNIMALHLHFTPTLNWQIEVFTQSDLMSHPRRLFKRMDINWSDDVWLRQKLIDRRIYHVNSQMSDSRVR